MARMTLRLPESLHKILETRANDEGISLNQYVVYALTKQVTPAYLVEPVTHAQLLKDKAEFQSLLSKLPQGDATHIEQILQSRPATEPEADLDPKAVAVLYKKMRKS